MVQGLEIFWKITAMMGISFWLGLFWRRTTVAGAWAASLTAMATWWLTTQSFFVDLMARAPGADGLRFVFEKPGGPEIYQPWQMIFYLVAGFGAGIVVSLVTRPVHEEKLEDFYALLRTPVTPGETVETPCTLPTGAVTPERRNLFPKTSLEIPVPSRTAVVGFLGGWLCVAAIITVFILLIS